MRRLLARLIGDRRGGVMILVAFGLTGIIAAAAFAADAGAVFSESRRLQGIADAAALSAADNMASADASARAAIAASGWQRPITPTVTTGIWTVDPALPVARRFAVGSPANAARVSVALESPLYFGRAFGINAIHLVRTATAARIDLAAFSLGSRLASLDGGIANQLLGGLTGTSVSLSAADYNALLGADVDLLAYVAALRTELALGAVSFDRVLATTTTLPHALNALSAALATGGNAAAANAVARIAAASPATSVTLSGLADLGALGRQDRAAGNAPIAANVFALLEAVLEISSGPRQIQLDIGALAPGLGGANATLILGQRAAGSPWLALTAAGTPIVRTAQARLFVEAALPGSATLRLAGITALRLPLYLELAEAQARLSALSCPGATREATLEVAPSIGHVAIADVAPAALADMSAAPAEPPATIAAVGTTRVAGAARIDLSDGSWRTVPFAGAEIAAGTVKSVSSSGIVGALASSAVARLDLSVTLAGIGVPLSPLIALVRPLLVSAAALLDPAVDGLLHLLGISLGQADVRVNGLRCGAASLVA